MKSFLRVFISVLILALLAVPAHSQPQASTGRKPLTLERIYGEPSLSGTLTTGLDWSPDGKLLSYTESTGRGAEAKREIRVLDLATGERRVLVSADKMPAPAVPPTGATRQQTGLGRAAPSRYLWAPDSNALLLVSPTELYWFDLKTQTARALVTGKETLRDPKISPDGRWVSFVRDYNLWVVEVAGGRQRQLTRDGREELIEGQLDWVYPEELEIRTAYWWAPDSSRLAFLEMDERPVTRYPLVNFLSYTAGVNFMRYPKAGDPNPIVRVGVVPVAGGKIAWMNTGAATDMYIPRVAWLPDSRRLAIQRLNRAQTRLELAFADALSGQAKPVLTEEDKYWINLHGDPKFLDDGRRFLWTSERDGFPHLYLYDVVGTMVKQLTRGAWEADLLGVDEKQGVVYFVSTEKSPIERHLYRVPLAGGEPARLTRQGGNHSINLSPNAAWYVDTYSNALTPPRQDVYRADGTRAAILNENKVTELAEYALSPVEFLTVRGATGERLHAFMIKPPDFAPSRRYPVLVYIYGGPHSQIVRDTWGDRRSLWHQMMAQKGYIIFGLDNRGMAARGHAFESPIYHHMGREELADQLAGVEYLKSLPYVDGSRIGIYGGSYGGYMTLNALFRAPDVFKAGVALAPVTDWRQYDTIYTERYMGLPQDNAEGYKESSPVTHAGNLRGKLLLAHGTGDDNVHFANTVELSEEFVKAGRYADLLIYPARGHGISDPPAALHLYRRITQFFLDNL